MTREEWLAKYGNESCAGCPFNNPTRASCSYRAGYCKRWDDYRRSERERERLPSLFDDEEAEE